MSIKVNLDTLDLPIFNPIIITTDKEALDCIDYIITNVPVIDEEDLTLLNICKTIVNSEIGEETECFGPIEIIKLSSLTEKYPIFANQIMAVSDHIVQSLDFFENKEIPAEKFLDVGLLIGNLAYPGWETSFAT